MKTELLYRVSRDCLAAGLRRAARTVTAIYEEEMAGVGVRGTQFSVLVALAIGEELPVVRLAEILGIERTTLTRSLELLERDRLVEDVSSTDARVHLKRLTAEGRRVLEAALPRWERAQARVVNALGLAEAGQLLDGLRAAAALS
jgi:DNA-binding MarR family transcriptional regulator